MSTFDLNKLPKDVDLAKSIIAAHYKDNETSKNNGFIGRVFGGKDNIANNVTAVIITVFSIALIIVICCAAGTPNFTYKDCVSSIVGLLTLFAGYMFGKANQK